MVNLASPSTRKELLAKVENVLQQDDPTVLKDKWEDIHNYYHSQAIMMPFYGKRIPTLLNKRLTGYEPGNQQFEYRVDRLVPLSGSTTVTIAPGARTGLFDTVGTMNAHVYGPNEFFSNNWVYEGLVAYGPNGKILPSLALDWTVAPNDIGGDTYTFFLRQGVKFHDGEDWNCAAAKLNFDHIFAGALGESMHGWYGVGLYTEDWSCNNDMEFVIRTNVKHGPYLQELTLIRPVRMISPMAFVNGNSTDPLSANSCHLDWGTVDGTDFAEEVTCTGIQDIAGTGPFRFDSKITADGADEQVVFTAHEDYWGGAPAVKRLEIIRYGSSEEVKKALLNEELDVVWGSGVLSDADIVEIQSSVEHQQKIEVFHSDPIQNVILLLNSGMPPFDDINVRKTVIHSINKAAIVEKELKGLQRVVDNVFPLQAPYCDVDLTPRWDYDFEKAVLLSCGGTAASRAAVQGDNNGNTLALGIGLGLGIPCAILATAFLYYMKKSSDLEAQLAKNEKATSA
jgi:nickel transport system substrate-binding protein